MKVLFLSQVVPYPPHGGVLQRGYNLLRELGRDARIHLLAFLHPNLLPTADQVEGSRRALKEFCETVEYFPLWAKTSPVHGAAALVASAFSSDPFATIAHRSGQYRRRVTELVDTGAFDVVHVDTLALTQFVSAARTIPAVLTHHNIESMLMERRAQVEKRPVAAQYLRRESEKLRSQERLAGPQYHLNILVSEDDERALKARVPGVRTAVVPNGVDADYFSPADERQIPAVIYTGGMGMFANRDAVMYFVNEIWPLITATTPDVRFFAVGRSPAKEFVTLASRDPRIVVTGFVDDIRPLVRQSAVYIVPLRVGGGTRLKVLDAMAMGKAIVSTSIGCEGIDVEPGRHLLVADTPGSFAEATVVLLGDPERRQRLGCAARTLAEGRYAWRVVGGQLVDAYRRAISLAGRQS